MIETVTLAHLSDLHLSPITGLALRHLNVKRGLGLVNWHRRRRSVHLPEVTAAILDDMMAACPDHIAVTGDLVNLGLPEEHVAALRWLQTLGPPDTVSVVPGNHDIYVRLRRDPGVARWRDYMTSDAWGREAVPNGETFPYLRRCGPIALIGANSAVPTAPFVAAGHLGKPQLAAIGAMLAAAAEAGLVRVVLIHHPPLPGQIKRPAALRDADALADVLARHGADLVLHGHAHMPMTAALPGPAAPYGVSLGVPSASAGSTHGRAPLASYHLFKINAGAGTVRIELVRRGLAAFGGAVVELERRVVAEGARAAAAPPTTGDRHELDATRR